VVLVALLVGARIDRPPSVPGLYRRLVWLAAWLLPAGYALAALTPRYEEAGLHVVYIGGFALMALSVGHHVAQAHGGTPQVLAGRPGRLVALAALILGAVVFRALVDLDRAHESGVPIPLLARDFACASSREEAIMMDFHRGQTAYDSAGIRLGRVIQCDESGFFIEKGLVFAEHYRVEYDEVASAEADQVRLRFTASELVPEEEADPWNPERDRVGTAGGTDIEPLRAGMAEIDEEQRRDRSSSAGGGKEPPPRRGARAWRDALAREVRLDESARAARRQLAPPSARRPERAPVESEGELEQRIEEEVEDFERGGGSGRRSDVLLERAAEERARAAASQGAVTGEGARAGGPPTRERRRQPAASAPRAPASPTAASPAAARRLDYAAVAPEAVKAMLALERYVRGCGLERPLLELVRMRASQLNGCVYCVDMHSQDARRGGETEQRLYALAVWEETPFFSPRERAALAWTEAVTRLGAHHVDDETYQLAREQFGEKELVNLTMAVIAINGWNRLAIPFRTEPGTYRPGAS
jgi:AhpD family alkylhydroperoxidase